MTYREYYEICALAEAEYHVRSNATGWHDALFLWDLMLDECGICAVPLQHERTR